jgi:hypothetical protein
MSTHKYPATGGGSGDVTGPSSSVDSEIALFSGTGGKTIKRATGSGYVKATSGVASYQAAPIPVADGGTNSTTALNNNRVIQSSGGRIQEAAAITASRALISDTNGIPTHSSVTTTELGYVSGVTSAIQTQLDAMVEKAGDTMSGALLANGGVDVTATGGTDTLSIGANNADVINIGRSGATVNIQGTTAFQDVTNYQVEDKNITINKGGSAGSGAASGIEIEEDSSITGYAQTSADRNSWELKAPNTAGVATVTPGAGGITLNQSSHDPVTIGTANGLSLSTQALSLDLADTDSNGALSSTDWNTFNNKLAIEGFVSVSTDVTLTNRRIHFVDTSAARSLTLPAASAGLYLVLKDVTGSASTNNITLVRPGSESIEGVAASYVLSNNRGSWTIVSDGSHYYVI